MNASRLVPVVRDNFDVLWHAVLASLEGMAVNALREPAN